MTAPRIALRAFTSADDAALLSWVPDAVALERIAGRTLTWPLTAEQLQGLRDEATYTPFTAHEPATPDVPVAHLEIVRLGPSEGRLARVVVDPARRGEGLGKPIVGAALDWAAAHGFTDVELRVFADNTPAIRTYAAVGFTTSEPYPNDDRIVVLRCLLQDR
ncbi:MAG TPA: GNAT family N-acetyltransferase [Baekduia sp.]|uniref:GNAT family N-acetyltransferase n=1 Tax=Baekduia sp. TaxID=2600305 RepID=UPI002CEF031B|nr:GNAT family N-acetyltransferase [Baekduia sp.]HMJ37579.1 GNAT family N-acetyltransferase [Baekduia sp.]